MMWAGIIRPFRLMRRSMVLFSMPIFLTTASCRITQSRSQTTLADTVTQSRIQLSTTDEVPIRPTAIPATATEENK